MTNNVAGVQLQSIVERIERLEGEKKSIADDIKDIYAEAKANGYDTKTLRKVVRLRKMDAGQRQEEEALLEVYMNALGMLKDTPLGEAAVTREFGASHLGPQVERAAKNLGKVMGKPVPLDEKEKAQGMTAAFVDKDGMRTSIGVKLGG